MIRAIPPLLVLCAVVAGAFLSAADSSAVATIVTRVSVSQSGAEVSGGDSMMPTISANGRYVAYASDAREIVPGNGATRDIFVFDRQTSAVELVSVAYHGGEADGFSVFPGLSADGRFVVFEAQAGDIVDDDDQNLADIYVRDRLMAQTRRVNLSPEGDDLNDDSLTPAISTDGRYVTYTSQATNVLPTDLNQVRDVFLFDLETNVTELISMATDGTQGDLDSGAFGAGHARVTGGGRYVVYGSFATNLVPDDLNLKDDIFLRDRLSGTTERVSIATDGTEGDDHSVYPTISEDGRYIVYYSEATTLVPDDTNGLPDAFVYDRQTEQTTRISGGTGVSESNGRTRFPEISGDGRFVVFQSIADNLVPGEIDENNAFDTFRYDMITGETIRLSVPDAGGEAHGHSTNAVPNGNASVIAFQSAAEDLVPMDNNTDADIFTWGKPAGPPLTPTSPPPTSTPTPTSGRIGDASGDGQINAIDAALVLQRVAGLLQNVSSRADANQDGQINAVDAALILQFSAGLLDSLPP